MSYNVDPRGAYYPPDQYGSNAPYPEQNQYQNQYQQQQPYPQQQHHHHHAPQAAASSTLDQPWQSTVDGISYSITNRDTNTLLNVRIPQGVMIKSRPGAMVQMSPSITLQGKVKFSMKKMFTGSEMAEAILAGPGEVSLAPSLFGDITTIPINGDGSLNMGKDAFLACTAGVEKKIKSQGLGKAFFSGEDMFLYRVSGQGLLWVTSFGAIVVRELQHNEQHIVDNGHLVAWSCQYTVERAGKGGIHSVTSGEGMVCRFTGPGKIYIQTRNMDEFGDWVSSQVRSN